MTRGWRPSRARCTLLLLLIGAVLSIWSGCSEKTTLSCPEVPAGSIRGQVRTGGAPIPAVVTAVKLAQDPGEMGIYESSPDSAGFYHLDVPPGRYLLSLRVGSYRTVYAYRRSGLVYGEAEGDTLEVAAGPPLGADFDLAAVRVRLSLPSGMDSLDADVALHRRGPQSTGWATYVDGGHATVRDGRVDLLIPGVLPGSYKIEVVIGAIQYLCDCPWDGEHFWLPGTRDSTACPWTEVPVDRIVEVAGQVTTEPARLEGEIGGVWRDLGIEAPAVALYTPDGAVVRGLRRVGSDGSFRVDMYLAGPVKILVDHERIQQWIGGPDIQSAHVFELVNGETTTGARLVESALRVDFTRPELPPGQPALRLYRAGDLSPAGALELPRPGMSFILPNLRPGIYLLYVEPHSPGSSSWLPQWYDRAGRPEDARPIMIGESELATAAVTLESGGRIQGAVLDPDPSREYLFYLSPAGERTRWALGYGGVSRQEFDFQGIPDGDWKVGAWPRIAGEYPEEPPENVIWYPGTTDWSAAGGVSVRDGGSVSGVEIGVAPKAPPKD